MQLTDLTTWQRSIFSGILGDFDAKVIFVENGREVVHVLDDDRDHRRRDIGWYLIVDQLDGNNLKGVNATVLQNSRILAIEGHVSRDQFTDRDVTLAGHLEIEVAGIFILQHQHQISRLAGVTVTRSRYQDRVTSWGVLRKRRAVRRIQENGWLILHGGMMQISFYYDRSDSPKEIASIDKYITIYFS